ncbi:alpha/beta-hydrolase [Punctularia strigosozonata HHB-11173 SS5]|uniref:alpha/beta-hydrolase n=1 Tax=Punctularia strigosozonata (strain HHB-11173) TaxID=741275 RepID=UPI0004417E72|nr:alpha/beta-hydrolase [Punctularia strigosozonata HHB-11173 SS5]EIN07109.1 alpha/beta-hydrolase [Punctularia strigosozonata HHB-11173 SS5]
MVAFIKLFVSSLLLASSAYAGPVRSVESALVFPPVINKGLLCKIPILRAILCPRDSTQTVSVSTPLGSATGVMDTTTAARYSVKYGSASRWKSSSVVTTWALPNGNTDPSSTPLGCPQSDADASSYSEDCLSMILYVPTSALTTKNLPVMMWIHGGSFVAGSATNQGLDGSQLAAATNSIVAVVQYRLGALGFMAPSGATNLAVGDVITSLKFLQKIVPSFGGSASKITLAGQSSGANMIRALLAVPSASSLFTQAIIQSDPMDYGFLSTTTQSEMQSYFNGLLPCAASNTTCLNALSLDTILDAQGNLMDDASSIGDGSAGIAEPIRPVRDGSLITSPLDSTAAFPSQSKNILISTVLNEAAFTIYGNFQDPVPEDEFDLVLSGTFDETQTNDIIDSQKYAVPAGVAQSTVDARTQLETLGTDYIWKCSSWTFARNWVSAGGKAFVGLYNVGASYPGNSDVSFCTEPGVVCHQDDIEIVFGTVPSPTSAQSALIKEMQARYKAFLNNGNPNVSGYETWTAAGTSDVHAKNLGATGEAEVGNCDPSYWGEAVQYDYQVFGI